jgi:hypothetical protein
MSSSSYFSVWESLDFFLSQTASQILLDANPNKSIFFLFGVVFVYSQYQQNQKTMPDSLNGASNRESRSNGNSPVAQHSCPASHMAHDPVHSNPSGDGKYPQSGNAPLRQYNMVAFFAKSTFPLNAARFWL